MTLITDSLISKFKNKKTLHRLILIPLVLFFLLVSLFLSISTLEYYQTGYFPWNQPKGVQIIERNGAIRFNNY